MPLPSVYAGLCPFDRRSNWCRGGQSLPWLLVRASSLLCGCAAQWELSLFSRCWSRSPQTHFWALVEGGGMGARTLGEEPELHPPHPHPVSELCCASCHLFCHLTKCSVAGTALGPISMGMPATGPDAPPGIASTGPPVQINQSQVPGPHSSLIWTTAGAAKAAQTLAQPSPQVHVPAKPLTAEATPVPAKDTPSVYSEVLQALNLQSQWQRCKIAACTTTA